MQSVKIVKIDEDEDIVCPVCHATAVDADEGLVTQPSCKHIRFVYANGEAFEYAEAGLEERLQAEEEKADEEGGVFDSWDALKAHCGNYDLILEQITHEMACGPVSFTLWVGVSLKSEGSRKRLKIPALKTSPVGTAKVRSKR
jgi:hypothetical protein